MKPTKNDIELFKALSGSQLGRDLANYLERLEDHIHDSRSWTDEDSKESAQQAARVIKTQLRQKLVPQKKSGQIDDYS